MLQAQTGSGSSLMVLVLQMAAIGLVFYFLILRPSGQAKKRHAALLENLKKGDEVMTSGGLVGKVRDIREVESEGVRETRVTLETGTATVVVERSRIVRIGGSAAPGAGAAPA
jgi:preprotein translocase subunit YajC